MRLRQKLLASLVLSPLVGSSALAKNEAGYDAFLASQEAKSLTATQDALLARGVRVEHQEERLGVPSFLWSAQQGVVGNKALTTLKPGEAAREHLRSYADLYRLNAKDLSGAELRNVHQTRRGPIVARFGQSVDGIEVFRNELKVVMGRNHELVAISGHLAPAQTTDKVRGLSARAFRMGAEEAIARGFQSLSGLAISPRSLVSTGKANGDYVHFSFDAGTRNLLTWQLVEPARAKKVYFTLPDRLEPAWYVEVNAGPKGSQESEYLSFVVSATDGALLLRNDLSSHATYRVWADSTTLKPHDGPQGTTGTPHPTGTPDRYQAPFIPSSLVTLNNYPFSRNDPWLPANATQTVGNNVDAYVDSAAPDGFQPETDLRATSTTDGVFDYTYDPFRAPGADDTQRMAAVVNLFYVNNFLHDWYYDAGFDEASGNAQALNYGRGGLEGDSIRAEAQDYSGRNNANMSTPADGARPRMQMYIFDGVPTLQVNSPAAVAGQLDSASASFGPVAFTLTGDVKILDTAGVTEGCTAFPAGTFTGKIALIDRGSCNFSAKALNAQNAGAVGVIIANNAANSPAPGLGGTGPSVTIPVLSTTQEAANAWKAEVGTNAATINVSMLRGLDLDRDGTLDNDIIAHEWGHYISNRLVGNANGLRNNQGRAMGEGWSDFHALLLQVREEDRNIPGNSQFQGIYTVGGYTQSGGVNNGYYFGIRRIPYSTDMSKNALTYKHIANGNPLPASPPLSASAAQAAGTSNSAVHSSGEVWATMLWECYASLLNAYPFQEAQDRMKQYLVAAYKATPSNPTMLEARDALLAVAAASDPGDYQRFLNAFAKRGAGLGAKGPDRDSQDHIGVVESFVAGNNLEVVSISLDDSATGCDQDGVLDEGETGQLKVTVRNTGATALSSFTTSISSSNASAVMGFPNGNSLNFPALQPNQTATAKLPVQLVAVTTAPEPRAGLTLTFNEPSLPVSARTATYDERLHYDEALGTSAKDGADGSVSAWVSSTLTYGNPGWKAMGQGTRYYHAPNTATVSDLTLTSPWLQVNPTGNFTIDLKHRWSFETGNGGSPYYDGGAVEISTDGLNWTDLFALGVNPGYTAFLEEGDNPLSGRPALVGLSTGFPAWVNRTINLGTLFAGKQVQLRFRSGSDGGVGAYGWDIDEVNFNNVANTPFGQLVAETSNGTACNRRPVAHAGIGRMVDEGTLNAGELQRTTVTLDGSGSFDADGQALAYTWSQVGGPPVALSATDVARPTFVADVAANALLTFQLVVHDGVESSMPQQVQYVVTNINRKPVALPTAPANIAERSAAPVTLSGVGSHDADGEALTFLWSQVDGPAVVLDNPTSPTPSFTVPEVVADTQLTFALTVNDGLEDSTTATVAVTVKNVDRAPVAHAGEAQNANARSVVTLNGSATDPEDDAITYAWTQVSGEDVTLEGADTASPTFTAPDVNSAQPAELVFQLVATANGLSSEPSTVTVLVHRLNRRPVALGPNDLEEMERTRVTLDASGSTDPDGDALTYSWLQTGGPLVTLEGTDTASLSFTTPDVLGNTLMTFRLLVSDDSGAESQAVTVSLTVKDVNRAPVALARKIAGGTAGQSVTLDASGSTDPDGDALTYSWKQVDGPSVTLSPADGSFTSFNAPEKPATFTFEVTVSDAKGVSTSHQVKVTTVEPQSAGGCSSTGNSSSSLVSLLMLGAGLFFSRRRTTTGRA